MRQNLRDWLSDPIHQRVMVLLVGGLVLRVVIAAFLPPGFDEAYYYVYTQHLSWSYFDHPPLVALTTGFGVWLTGQVSQLTIRLGALGLYTGSLIFLYLTARILFTPAAAGLTLAIATLIPIFQVGFGILTLPDSPLMFFWSAGLYCAAQEFFRRFPYKPSCRLAVLGLLLGLACLSKYHGFVLAVGLVGFCGLSRAHRAALVSPWLGLAGALFLLALTPVLVWNAQHDWVSFVYQSSRARPTAAFAWTQSLVTGLLGIAYLFPSLGVPLWWAIARSCRALLQPARTGNPAVHAFLLWVSLPLILGLIMVGGYQPILPTWPMPGFWGVTLLLGDRAACWQQRFPGVMRRWLLGSGVAIALLLLVGLSHVSAGRLQKPGGWFGGIVPIATDASTQLVDIQQIRRGVVQQPQVRQALQQADFVFTNQIFLAGQVAMAIAPLTQAPVTCFSDDLRGFAFWSTPETWLGKNGLYVTSATFENEGSARPYRDYFQAWQEIGTIPLRRGGQTVEVFKLFSATRLLVPYPRPAQFALSGSGSAAIAPTQPIERAKMALVLDP